MSAFRRGARTTLLVALLCWPAGAIGAQSYTLADIFGRLRAGAAIVGLSTTQPAVYARLEGLERYAEATRVMPLGLDALVAIYADAPPAFTTILRVDRGAYEPAALAALRDTLAAIGTVAHAGLEAPLAAAIGRDSLLVLYAPVYEFDRRVLRAALAGNTERLRRFAIKYGPDAPKLNVVEALLNYGAQLAAPRVFLGTGGAPSPWELVASYRTTDLTASRPDSGNRALRLVSSAQLGMRWYNFAPGCEVGSRLGRLLHPCHASAGAFLMGPSDTPLTRITGQGHRAGLYAAWGDYHAGFVPGAERRFVVGVDTQVLPYLF